MGEWPLTDETAENSLVNDGKSVLETEGDDDELGDDADDDDDGEVDEAVRLLCPFTSSELCCKRVMSRPRFFTSFFRFSFNRIDCIDIILLALLLMFAFVLLTEMLVLLLFKLVLDLKLENGPSLSSSFKLLLLVLSLSTQ